MAFTLDILDGAEVNGLQRLTSAGSASISTAVRSGIKGAHCYTATATSSIYIDLYEFHGASAGTKKVVGGWVKGDFSASLYTIMQGRAGDNTQNFKLSAASAGTAIRIVDADNATLATPTGIFDTTNWHFIEFYYDEVASGDWELFVDNVSVASGAGANFVASGGATVHVVWFFTPAGAWWDDLYVGSGAASSADRLGNLDIWANIGDGSATTGGDALDGGTWPNTQEIPANDTNTAQYNDDSSTPTERLAPDSIAVQTNQTGSVTDIDDDPDSPDGLWMDATGKPTLRVTFPTPSGNPLTGGGLQEIKALLRKSATGPTGSTERIAPDVLTTQTGLSGAVTDIDDDPDSPDSLWLTTNASNSVMLAQFGTPTGNPVTGAGQQEIKVWVRKDAAGGGDPLMTVEVHDTDGLHATLATDTLVTSSTGALYTYTFDATGINSADGATIAINIIGSKGGGGPNERNLEIGAVEWNCTYGGSEETPGYAIKLFESGVEVSAAGSATGPINDAGGDTVVAFTWDAVNLGTADGSLVECEITQTDASPTRFIDIGAVEWNCQYSSPAALQSGWIQADSGAKAGPSGMSGLNTIIAASYYIRSSNANDAGADNISLVFGNSVDGTTSVSLGATTAALADYFRVEDSSGFIPTVSQHSRAGFASPANNQADIIGSEVIAMFAHVPAWGTVGSGSPTLPIATATGVATHTIPARTGSGSPGLPMMTAAGASTHSPPVFSAIGAVTIPMIGGNGLGTHSIPGRTGSGATSLPIIQPSGTGNHSPPVFSGSGSTALPMLSASGTATNGPPSTIGTGAPTLPLVVAEGAATNVPPNFIGSGSPGLPMLTAVGAGTHVPPTISGSGAPTLPMMGGTGSGSQSFTPISGNGSASLPALAASGDGTHTPPVFSGSGSPALPMASATGAATHSLADFTGTGAPALPKLGGTGTGTHSITPRSGTGAPALPMAAAEGAATHNAPGFNGAGSPGLPMLGATGAATHTPPVVSAAGSPALPMLVGTGTGTHSITPHTGSGAPVLPLVAATGTATNTSPVVSGSGSPSLPMLAATGAGTNSTAAFAGSGVPGLPMLVGAGAGTHTPPVITGLGAVLLPMLGSTGAASGGQIAVSRVRFKGPLTLTVERRGPVATYFRSKGPLTIRFEIRRERVKNQKDYIGMGVIGLPIWIESTEDLTSATSIKIRLEKPDGTTVDVNATAVSIVETGYPTRYGAQIVTVANTLDQAGTWYAQIITNLGAFDGPGRPIPIEVSEPIAAP